MQALSKIKFACWWGVVMLLAWSAFNAWVFTAMAMYVGEPSSIVQEYWKNFILMVLFIPLLVSLVLWNHRNRTVRFPGAEK